MKINELLQNEELLKQFEKDVAAKISQGMDVEAAKQEACKALGVEFDEDAVQAEKVGKMEMSEEELDHVAGGEGWCWNDHACIAAYNHDDNGAPVNGCERDHGNMCAWDYECLTIAGCDKLGVGRPHLNTGSR